MDRAGARLGIAASDLAVTVMALERSLDVALISLGPGGVELTAAGRRFLRTARALAEPRALTDDVDPDDASPSSP